MGDGEDSCVVVVGGGKLGEAVEVIFVQHFVGVGPGVVDVDLCAILLEFMDDVDHPGVADVGAVLLEGDAEDEHFCPFDFVVAGNHEFHHFGGDVLPHIVVKAAPCEDNFRVVTVLLGFLGKIVGVNADTVASDEAGFEGEKVPYGGCDHFVGVEFFFAAALELGLPGYRLKDLDTSSPNNRKFPERETLPLCLTLARSNLVGKSGNST